MIEEEEGRMIEEERIEIRSDQFPPGMVAVPCLDMMPSISAAAISFVGQHVPPGSVLHWDPAPGVYVGKRNRIVREFLGRAHLEWLLFLDSDMVPPPHSAIQLLFRDLDIVGGLYFTRHGGVPAAGHLRSDLTPDVLLENWDRIAEESDPLVGLQERSQTIAIQEVDFIGMGCTLIRRGVFEAMSDPWFVSLSESGRGEDIAFCLAARAAGFEVHVDLSFPVGHLGLAAFELQDSGNEELDCAVRGVYG